MQGEGKTFNWVGVVSTIHRDEEQFGRNPSLQSSCSWEDRLAQLFPMGYCDYLKKMRKSSEWDDHVTLQRLQIVYEKNKRFPFYFASPIIVFFFFYCLCYLMPLQT